MVHQDHKVPMTLKIHVIYHHYRDYFDWTGKTLKYNNGEFCESTHSTLRKEEGVSNFKVTKAIGTPIHQQKSLQSLVWHNSKKAGQTPSCQMRLRFSSPRSEPDKKEYKFSQRFLKLYQKLSQ